MELRLQKFIDSLASLSDIRNLDPANPVFVNLEHPVSRNLVVTIASTTMPAYLGIPVHTIWVVLDPSSPYYGQALRFRGWVLPTVYMEALAQGFTNAWTVVQRYAEIFENDQYYESVDYSLLKGDPGDPGPRGPIGPRGPAGTPGERPTIDYDYLVTRVAQLTGI